VIVTDAPTPSPAPDAAELPQIDPPEVIDELRLEIDRLDREILRLVQRRSEVSQRIGRARMAAGGPRIGLSPLSTSFDEVERGLAAVAEALR
jgi:chorismate mutase